MTCSSSKIVREKSAFTLIELAIVIAIIGLLISGAATVSTTALKNAKVKITKERLEKIQEAIDNFVYINRKLPCPAPLTAIPTDVTYAVSQGNPGECAATGIFFRTPTNAPDFGLVYGSVPAKTLGLSSEFAEDGFGNKFSYVVIPQSTTAFVPETEPNPVAGFEIADIADIFITDPITIKETLSGSAVGDIIANYIIISHGPNGFGAFNVKSNSAQNPVSSVADEASNSYAANFDTDFILRSNNSAFDDIIVYATKEEILKRSGLSHTRACSYILSGIHEPCSGGEINGFAPARYGEIGMSAQDCGIDFTSCPYSAYEFNGFDDHPARRCGADGKWESPLEYPCLATDPTPLTP